MDRQIRIFDTTLRDGEQSPGASMSTEQKITMAISLEKLGVDRIEAGFPVSSPIQYEAVKRIGETVKEATVVGLARCVNTDIDAVYNSLKNTENRMLHVFIATSPLHREFKLKMGKKEILRRIKEKLQYGKNFFKSIEFSAEDASRTEPEFLIEVIKTALQYGANTVNIPDTVGYSTPDEFGNLIGLLISEIPGLKGRELSVHCHNDLGLAVANSLSAVKNGATQVEVTINGIGERAGNCSLEEFVMLLNVRKDILNYSTNIKTDLLYPTSKLLQNITGLLVSRNKPLFGDNAFSHESGIHQDGVIKNKETYEIMKPESIGRGQETLIMGRHSGKHAFLKKLNELGVELNKEQFEMGFEKFTKLADKKKEVYDEDILHIISSILGTFDKGYKLEYFNSTTGNNAIPSGTIKIKEGDNEYIASAYGDGPIDALFKSIETALGIKVKLNEFQIQAIGPFKEAMGQVRIGVEIDNNKYIGKGTSTDILEASIFAYLNAINSNFFNGGKGEKQADNE